MNIYVCVRKRQTLGKMRIEGKNDSDDDDDDDVDREREDEEKKATEYKTVSTCYERFFDSPKTKANLCLKENVFFFLSLP